MPARLADPAQSRPWRQWYSLQRSRKRAKHQLTIEPLCALCLERNQLTPGTVADHHPAHKGDWNAFQLGPAALAVRGLPQPAMGDRREGLQLGDRRRRSSARSGSPVQCKGQVEALASAADANADE